MPRALYGVESTPVPAKSMASLGNSFKHAICPGVPTMGSQCLHVMAWGVQSPDPRRQVLLRRVLMAKR
eukprot:7043752-Alexandrium_andersonii.AAC.1